MARTTMGLKAMIVKTTTVAKVRRAMRHTEARPTPFAEPRSESLSIDCRVQYCLQTNLNRPKLMDLDRTVETGYPYYLQQKLQGPILSQSQSMPQPFSVAFHHGIQGHESNLEQSVGYEMRVQRGQSEWVISRRYYDFQRLFQAMTNHFPGTIFPYFPSSAIHKYLQSKINELNLQLQSCLLAPRKQELADFLKVVCSNRKWICKQLQRFLSMDFNTKEIKPLIVGQGIGSKSFSLMSFVSVTLPWLSNRQEKEVDTNQLLRIKYHFNTYSEQIIFFISKFNALIQSKNAELANSEQQTEIDSIQTLRAKIISAKPFTQQLLAKVEAQIMVRLVQELKKEGQIREQINKRVEMGKHLQHIRRADDNDQRIDSLASYIKKFDSEMLLEWRAHEQGWKKTVGQLDDRFRCIWVQYSEKASKIWR